MKGRGWVPIEETEEYQRKVSRQRAQEKHAERMIKAKRERDASRGIEWLFGDVSDHSDQRESTGQV